MPSRINTLGTQLAYVLTVPFFFLAFLIGYRPADMTGFFSINGTMLSMNALLLMCIILGVMMVSRLLLFLLRNHMRLTWLGFAGWCLAELTVAAFFMALYMSLMYKHITGPYLYFKAVGMCLGMLLAIEWVVYIILPLVVVALEPAPQAAADDTGTIRFFDKTQKLKYIIHADAVLYVKADENYVNLVYMEGDKVKSDDLRNSMKAIEGPLTRHGLLRCHRSYYINPKHVKSLARNKEGIMLAYLSVNNVNPVPVSATYQQTLSERL